MHSNHRRASRFCHGFDPKPLEYFYINQNPPMSLRRHQRPIDRLLIQLQHAASTTQSQTRAHRTNPGAQLPEPELIDKDRAHAAGLMRVNHTGEVCAQALYLGQAAVARDENTRKQLLEAAQEEQDHLAWCSERLDQLHSRPSLLNPLWYAGSYAIGLAAGLRGDGWNLGFVVETERQVEAHLEEHLDSLPAADEKSRTILRVMKADEAAHADHALQQGARLLPQPIPRIMALTSSIMKAVAYRL
jgi:3-demethoxyubiquinol 3-hydroxylase